MSTIRAERHTVLHTWCVQADWDAPAIVGGQGARFWDEHGRVLLDMSSLSECMNLGHQHPALVEAIQAQAAALCFTTAAWEPGLEPGWLSCCWRSPVSTADGCSSRSAGPTPTSMR
jgi:4-aminobutyrate aminotransferase-like enzyme